MTKRRGYFRGFTASEKPELWDRWQREELREGDWASVCRDLECCVDRLRPPPKADIPSFIRSSRPHAPASEAL